MDLEITDPRYYGLIFILPWCFCTTLPGGDLSVKQCVQYTVMPLKVIAVLYVGSSTISFTVQTGSYCS